MASSRSVGVLSSCTARKRVQWQAGSERKIALTCLATLSATAPDIPPTPDVGTRNKPIAFIGLGHADTVACGVTDSSAGTPKVPRTASISWVLRGRHRYRCLDGCHPAYRAAQGRINDCLFGLQSKRSQMLHGAPAANRHRPAASRKPHDAPVADPRPSAMTEERPRGSRDLIGSAENSGSSIQRATGRPILLSICHDTAMRPAHRDACHGKGITVAVWIDFMTPDGIGRSR